MTITPSPVRSRATLLLTRCAVSVKWASLTAACSGFFRISAALGALADCPALPEQAASTAVKSASIGMRRGCINAHATCLPEARLDDGVVERKGFGRLRGRGD